MQVMGFGQYITSGFDQYEGHSAIGFGRYSSNPASADQFGIGVIYGEVIEGMYTNLNGGSFTKGTLGNLYAAIIF